MTPGHPFVVGEDAGKHHELTCPGGFRAGSQGGLPDTFGAATVPRPCTGLVTCLAGSGSPDWPVALGGGPDGAPACVFATDGYRLVCAGRAWGGWPGSSWVSSSEGPPAGQAYHRDERYR